MPIVVSPSLTKTAGGQDMYQPISTNDNEVVNGTLTVSGTSTLNGPVTINSTLAVTGATTLGSTLGVTGASTLTGAVSLGSTLAVAGATTLSGILNNLPFGSLSASTPATISYATPAGTANFWSMVIAGWRFTWGTVLAAGAAGAGQVTVTFPTPYAGTPLVLVTPDAALVDVNVANTTFQASLITPNDFKIIFQANPPAGFVTATRFQFLIIGQN
jgi:hypothetical protein